MYRLIRQRFDQSKQTYGYRRMTMAMSQHEGLLINEKKIRRIMRKFHFKPRYLRRFRYYSDTRIRMAAKIQPDALRRQFNQAGLVTYITYLIW
jgi:transposase InsO family protein